MVCSLTLYRLLNRLLRSMLMTVTMPMTTVAVTMIRASAHHRRWLLSTIHLQFFLLCNLLNCHKALFTHLYSFRHIADRGIFYIYRFQFHLREEKKKHQHKIRICINRHKSKTNASYSPRYQIRLQ